MFIVYWNGPGLTPKGTTNLKRNTISSLSECQLINERCLGNMDDFSNVTCMEQTSQNGQMSNTEWTPTQSAQTILTCYLKIWLI